MIITGCYTTAGLSCYDVIVWFFQEESDTGNDQQGSDDIMSSDEEEIDEDTSWVWILDSYIHNNVANIYTFMLIFIHCF